VQAREDVGAWMLLNCIPSVLSTSKFMYTTVVIRSHNTQKYIPVVVIPLLNNYVVV